MASISKTTLFTLRKNDEQSEVSFAIKKRQVIMGNHPLCDLVLVSDATPYHAFFCLTTEGLLVKDLCSDSGIFVNGTRINEAILQAGDTLTVGNNNYQVEVSEDIDFELAGLPITPSFFQNESMALPEHAGNMVFIDGEYCDVLFNDKDFIPRSNVPALEYQNEYDDLEELEVSFDLATVVEEKRLEIISYINGMIQDVRYLKIKNGDYFLSPERSSSREILFSSLERIRLFSYKNNQIKFYPQASLTPSVAWESIDLNQPFFLTAGTEQVSLRLVEKTFGLANIPLLFRDREFFRSFSKVFFILFLPMLLLTLVDIEMKEEEKKKEMIVIYKLPKPSTKPTPDLEKSELSAKEVTSQVENTGHKQQDQPTEKVEFAQASDTKETVAKAATPTPVKKPAPTAAAPAQAPAKTEVAKTPTSAPAQTLAPAPVQTSPVAAAPAPAVEVKPAKPYSFKSSAVGSLVSDAPSLNAGSATQQGGSPDKSFNVGTSANGELVAGANIGVSKVSGFDSKGSGSSSFGSRGLAAKSGFDSAYLDPNTVVMGSIDPELVRKILREYIPQFRHCYQQELIKADNIKGVLDLEFTIGPDGKTTKYNVLTKNARFTANGIDCMGRVLGYIQFPKPKGGGVVDIKQPMNFLTETKKL
jgi:outer membrane biosynthesis protein TonB